MGPRFNVPLAHNANIPWPKYLWILFFHLALFMACQVQFEIYHSAMFIIHKHQINTAIHKNYLALQQNCWLMSLAFVFQLRCRISHSDFIWNMDKEKSKIIQNKKYHIMYFYTASLWDFINDEWSLSVLQIFNLKYEIKLHSLQKICAASIQYETKHVILNFPRTSAAIFQIFPPAEDVH